MKTIVNTQKPQHAARSAWTIILLFFYLLTAGPLAASVVVEFNTNTAFTNNFTTVGGTTLTSWNSSQGRGGSGTMFLQSSGFTANVYSGSGNEFSLNVGESLVASYFFYSSGTRSANNNIGLYLSGSSDRNPLEPTNTSGLLRTFFYNMDPTQSPDTNQSNFRYSGTGGTGNVGTNFTGGGNNFWYPITNSWYQLEVIYTKTVTTNLWDVTVHISNWGTNGTNYDAGSLITLNQSITNADIYSDSTIYVGFESYQQSRGATKIDTFSIDVIPEPTTTALLGLGVIGIFLWGARCGCIKF